MNMTEEELQLRGPNPWDQQNDIKKIIDKLERLTQLVETLLNDIYIIKRNVKKDTEFHYRKDYKND